MEFQLHRIQFTTDLGLIHVGLYEALWRYWLPSNIKLMLNYRLPLFIDFCYKKHPYIKEFWAFQVKQTPWYAVCETALCVTHTHTAWSLQPRWKHYARHKLDRRHVGIYEGLQAEDEVLFISSILSGVMTFTSASMYQDRLSRSQSQLKPLYYINPAREQDIG